jgi:uncharacterized protein (TIGR03083 family)
MEIREHIAALQRDGELLAAAASRAGLPAAVPSCPPWRVRDLLRHQGYVHRWAAGFVRDQRMQPLTDRPSETELLSDGPPESELPGWYVAGHAALVDTLRRADPDVQCWTFLAAPSPLAFWARRQAHETAIHRVDAELAAGGAVTFPAGFAADGIDELIMGFLGRDVASLPPGQDGPRTLLVSATDAGADWLVGLSADGSVATSVQRGGGAADCRLTGPASALYLMLWNRQGPEGGVTVSGDADLLTSWQSEVRVTWG